MAWELVDTVRVIPDEFSFGYVPTTIEWHDDGNIFVTVSATTGKLQVHTASTPYDMLTLGLPTEYATLIGSSVSLTLDGHHMYFGKFSASPTEVYHYTMATAFDFANAVLADSFALAPNSSVKVKIANDGSKFYFMQYNEPVNQYTLVTPFVLTGMTFDGSYPSHDTREESFSISPDGTRVYFGEYIANGYGQYNLSTPYDLASRTYVGRKGLISGDGMAWNTDGTKLFTLASSYMYYWTWGNPDDSSATIIASSKFDGIIFGITIRAGSTLSGAVPKVYNKTYRVPKGSELTDTEIDDNFNGCDKIQTTTPTVVGTSITSYNAQIIYLTTGTLSVDGSGNCSGTGYVTAMLDGFRASASVYIDAGGGGG